MLRLIVLWIILKESELSMEAILMGLILIGKAFVRDIVWQIIVSVDGTVNGQKIGQ